MDTELISVVIPVYNEEQSLSALFSRLFPVMSDVQHEIIFINDGSQDKSLSILQNEQKNNSHIKVIDMGGNYGQHRAIMKGFEQCAGGLIITMDADLQNPPEEIPKIISEYKRGHDVIGTIRINRQDNFFRKKASRIVNKITNIITGFKISDYGCMLRGYSRNIITEVLKSKRDDIFIPALAQKLAQNPVEIEISHSEREYGRSKYSLYRLIKLFMSLIRTAYMTRRR
ncbi:MAG: glycosyltransferase [Synergistales bacterium]|nr:glycosyltransferase [Synergistales bacterium]MDY6401924.1 glycosyltransferase [Synergistales bacterium]MDY6403938.1 glycosyltransferase [Synergistales bacterium]MDY6411264.1 glycosyltransferase [Synergistales bacterium]MDY6414846.1 glycosyltransferase [Synergistales bacterium]